MILQRTSVQAALVIVFVLLLRLPFLSQAIQGDDFYYLKGAEHALIDPLHPNHARYIFQGDMVDMRGHPHPPLNSWTLAALLVLFKDVHEVPFHAAYILFSIIAALSALAIARRFCAHPLAATLLFLVTPAFVINGTSLEADLPFAAFFLAAIACFIYDRFLPAALAAAIAALFAYQAIVLAPILLCYNRRPPRAWSVALAAPATVAAFQIFERVTSGALPATVLAGYMSTYGLQTLAIKLKNAAALTGHAAWIVCPLLAVAAFGRAGKWRIAAVVAIGAGAALYDPHPLFAASVAIGALLLIHCLSRPRDFLCAWIVIFFAAALVIFFAGSARYLLPAALPIAILTAQRIQPKWLYAGAAATAVLSMLLAIVNYQHWDGYRALKQNAPRLFVNGEWGLRYYLESEGALPLERGQTFRAGDVIVSSAYAKPAASGTLAPLASREITSAIPLRIVALGAKSGYSSVAFGLRPFDISTAPMDRVRTEYVTERKPELSALKIGTAEAAAQIVSGVYSNDRWTAERATVILKRPPDAREIQATFDIHPQSPARTITLFADGRRIAQQTYPGPGQYKITAAAPAANPISVTLQVDKTFSVPPDQRQLGVLLIELALR